MTSVLRVAGDGLTRFGNLTAALSDGEIGVIATRALNHTGAKAKTQVTRALTKQTGLPRKVIVKALRVRKATGGNPVRGTPGRLEYRLETSGGDISLKYFGARETKAGVSAAPFGKRAVFAGTFIMGGRFPGRVALNMGGHVFKRVGSGRIPIAKQDSGVVIPTEMVKGATAAAFEQSAAALSDRLSHEMARSSKLRDLTGGVRF